MTEQTAVRKRPYVTMEFMHSQSNIDVGEYRFDPSTGELVERESGNQSRLPPQPTKLLTMLIEKRPDVVTREEIQESLWPGIRSDFDKNLHFCVRQVRSALGDSASQPTYVETIPRRGYRLIAEVAVVEPDVDGAHKSSTFDELVAQNANGHQLHRESEVPTKAHSIASADGSSAVRFVWAGLLALLVVALAGFWIYLASGKDKVRVAVMPFKTDQVEYVPMGNGEIGMGLLEVMASDMDKIDLIGPTTTENYVRDNKSLKELAMATKVDFIVNGKFMVIEERHRVLVEVIRAHDGSHVWVKSFGPSTSNQEIAELTASALKEQIAKTHQ